MIRGEKRVLKIDVSKVHKEVKFAIHNRFDVEVVDAATGEVKQKAYAENIVLNALWTKLLAPATYFNYIHYGSGSGTLAVSRTSLFTFLNAKAVGASTIEKNLTEGYMSFRRAIQISESENVGSEFKEVGIGYGSAAANLVTHALLKDMNGNTISIVKTGTDIINIYATVFVHWNTTKYDSATIEVNALSPYYDLFSYLGGISASPPTYLSFYKGEGFSQQGGPNTLVSKTATVTYNAAAKTITFTSPRLAAADGNGASGIKSIGLGGTLPNIIFTVGGSWYPKASITGESIGTGDGATVKFATKFPFVRAGAKIYVNGVEQLSGVAVTQGKPNSGYLDPFMKVLSCGLGSKTYQLRIPSPGSYWENNGWSDNNWCIWENPFYLEAGIESMLIGYCYVYVSDDLDTWTQVASNTSSGTSGITANIAEAYQKKRYWKVVTGDHFYSRPTMIKDFACSVFSNFKNITFDVAPASGTVITADYDCEVIAKDTNHVFDFSFILTLAEKTT